MLRNKYSRLKKNSSSDNLVTAGGPPASADGART
jgi:hypothetical protein